MLKLCAKDILAARWILLAGLAVLFCYSLQPFFPAGFILAAGGALALADLGAVFFLEDRNKTEALYLSLPVKRSAIVGARYLLGALSLLTGGAVVFGGIAPASALLRPRSPESGLSGLLSLEAPIIFLVVTAFFIFLYLPFYHRLGFGRGTIVFLIVGIVILSSGAAWLSAALPAVFARSGGTEAIFGAVRTIRMSLGTPLFLFAAAALVVVPCLISHRFSVRFYEKREF